MGVFQSNYNSSFRKPKTKIEIKNKKKTKIKNMIKRFRSHIPSRGGSRTAATPKMELFAISR